MRRERRTGDCITIHDKSDWMIWLVIAVEWVLGVAKVIIDSNLVAIESDAVEPLFLPPNRD